MRIGGTGSRHQRAHRQDRDLHRQGNADHAFTVDPTDLQGLALVHVRAPRNSDANALRLEFAGFPN